MENYEVADILKETARLMELHGENAFKIKSYQNASFKLDRLTEKLEGKTVEELEKVDGIGKSLSVKIHQLLNEGTFSELQKLIDITPEGVLQMMKLKGIGPKKVAVLWKELEVETLGELLYACNENRLIELKGFGSKTQEAIKQAIHFKIASQGFYHYATAEVVAFSLMEPYISSQSINWSFTGEFRRKCEVVSSIDLIVTKSFFEILKIDLLKNPLIDPTTENTNGDAYVIKNIDGIPIKIYSFDEKDFAFKLWQNTSTSSHIDQALKANNVVLSKLENCKSEYDIYNELKLPFIQPELREGIFEIELALKNQLPELLELADLKGILHNHTTDSDGINTLEEMAVYCKNMGMEYLGICDHSKSAFYANGLSIERVLEQHERIDELNKKLAPFKIFKGIESDILTDGSLDYPDEILAKFDFIVGSIHSGLKMDEEKATQRLINAIKNPYCTILGHPTGRLLLARKGYPINHQAVIDACAENGVAIELNAHPYRLDLDWRWIQYALSKNVMISINPDAHATSGFHDMHFGVCIARKGGLYKEMTFNAKNLEEITQYFIERKKAIE